MKNILKTFFTLFFALTMTTPAEVLANPAYETNDAIEEETHSTKSANEGHTIVFLRSDFGLSPDRENISDQAGSLVMFMTNPKRKIIKNAQVVVTIVSQSGDQFMSRALPYKGGYLIRTDSLDPGHYRLDAEIVTDGWLLTDQFYFEHA